jgi:hypothetical protein
MILALPLLMTAACNVDNDAKNDQVSVTYNEQRIEQGANDAARAAKEAASGIGNVAATTGRAIKNEVGDIDVDVDVRRNQPDRRKDEASSK